MNNRKILWIFGITAALMSSAYLAGRCSAPDPNAVTPGVTDTVWVDRPEPKPTIKERIVFVNVTVERVVTLTKTDTLVVKEFVDAAQNPDSLPPVHLPYAGEYRDDRLRLWGTMSNGDQTLHEFDVREPFQFGWAADSAYVRESRLARFPKYKIAGGAIVVGGVILCALRC